ncbi:hypothetical protein ABRQ22_15375 [Cellulosimicrobium sp. ES-005]|uniref:Uncharacterized protein n=1 Tax=Cellulosimicrobium sp. ES-005 TaxID=3163031 RepID=A0AAU8FZS2_9MICO
MSTTTPTPTSFGRVQDTALELRGVLDTALPRELGTEAEPQLYTVTAVFSRRVSGPEQALLELPAVTARLADRGYPGIVLRVEDRRLLVENTNLAILSGGLAHEIATVLRDVEETITNERTRKADELAEWRAAEVLRTASVKAEADRVRFE